MTVSGERWRDLAVHIHVSVFPPTPLPSRLLHNIEQSCLCYTVSPCWFSILNISVCTKVLAGTPPMARNAPEWARASHLEELSLILEGLFCPTEKVELDGVISVGSFQHQALWEFRNISNQSQHHSPCGPMNSDLH